MALLLGESKIPFDWSGCGRPSWEMRLAFIFLNDIWSFLLVPSKDFLAKCHKISIESFMNFFWKEVSEELIVEFNVSPA